MSDPTEARRGFEHWYSERGQIPKAIERHGDNYKLAQAQYAWEVWKEAWQSSRDELSAAEQGEAK